MPPRHDPAGGRRARPPAPVHRVTNRNSGKVVDVVSASTANNAEIKQWTWNGGGNQKWEFQDSRRRLLPRRQPEQRQVPGRG
ncbi:RICIN domain-containing protein [Nonomuraea ferruginea]